MKLKTGLFLISLVFLAGQGYGIYQMHYYLKQMGEVMTTLPDLFWFYDASFTAWMVFFVLCFMFYLVFSILFNCIPKWKSEKSFLERLFR